MSLQKSCIKFHSSEDEERLLRRDSLPISPEAIRTEWKNVLRSATREQEAQDFLERYPELLPGLLDLHNGPLHRIVVSKFPFGADYKCDFAFVTRHSMALQFTFIEIEDPTKPVFNKDGSFNQFFNHARQQIADWKIWADKNINTLVDMFSPMFETYNAWDDHKDFRFYLVCGRRNEVESDRKRKERWSSIQASSENKTFVMSYDRLRLFENVQDRLIVCTYENRGFYAKSELL
jgi:hypothetical protein